VAVKTRSACCHLGRVDIPGSENLENFPRNLTFWGMNRLGLLLLSAALVAGCSSSVSARKVMPLDEFKRVFVETRLNDNHRLDELLAAELRRIGKEASSGPRTMMPENTDAVLTYTDTWTGDFHYSLLDLTVELHTVRGQKKLAEGRYYQPDLVPKKPDVVVRELIARVFAK
jgi:hypothetical protein